MPCQESEPLCGRCSLTDRSVCEACADGLVKTERGCECEELEYLVMTDNEPSCRTCISTFEHCLTCDGVECFSCLHGYEAINGLCERSDK